MVNSLGTAAPPLISIPKQAMTYVLLLMLCDEEWLATVKVTHIGWIIYPTETRG